MTNNKEEIFVGVDVGSATVKVVGVNGEGKLAGQPVCLRISEYSSAGEAVKHAFSLYQGSAPPVVAGLGTTGSGRELNRHVLGADLTRTEIFAHATGIQSLVQGGCLPEIDTIGTVIEIGGQDAKVIIFDREGIPVYFNMNSICAAGTGEFLLQIADDAGIPVEEFGPLALASSCPAKIDSTCTVFAKRDFRHLTQKGVPLADRLAGLCQAMVHNYLHNVLINTNVVPPIVFQGGVAGNSAMVEAFRRRLNTRVIVPPLHQLMGAYGMALIVREEFVQEKIRPTSFKKDFLQRTFESRAGYCHGCSNSCEIVQPVEIKPGREPVVLDHLGGRCERSHDAGNIHERPSSRPRTQVAVIPAGTKSCQLFPLAARRKRRESRALYFGGIDGGSRATKYALIFSRGRDFEVATAGTLDTGGDAIGAAMSALRRIKENLPADAVLGACGATGSAGELIRDMICTSVDGADYLATEILAHYAWAAYLYPDVGTVMDIGGNDSKIILIRPNGLDFSMNDKCAAGTGSFLEAVARRFEVPLENYGKTALTADSYARVAGRCAVFGESDLIHKARLGFPVNSLLMGLCYAIARTYLSDVAKGKRIQLPVVAQGGGFLNEALQHAFRDVLQLAAKDFRVHPDPRFVVGAGALGAALLSRVRYEGGKPSSFKGFDRIFSSTFETVSTTCQDPGCSRRCAGVVALLENGKPIAGYKSIDCDFGLFDGMLRGDEDVKLVASTL